jgi:hypothetical protein
MRTTSAELTSRTQLCQAGSGEDRVRAGSSGRAWCRTLEFVEIDVGDLSARRGKPGLRSAPGGRLEKS